MPPPMPPPIPPPMPPPIPPPIPPIPPIPPPIPPPMPPIMPPICPVAAWAIMPGGRTTRSFFRVLLVTETLTRPSLRPSVRTATSPLRRASRRLTGGRSSSAWTFDGAAAGFSSVAVSADFFALAEPFVSPAMAIAGVAAAQKGQKDCDEKRSQCGLHRHLPFGKSMRMRSKYPNRESESLRTNAATSPDGPRCHDVRPMEGPRHLSTRGRCCRPPMGRRHCRHLVRFPEPVAGHIRQCPV